jgi:hypothetical protein
MDVSHARRRVPPVMRVAFWVGIAVSAFGGLWLIAHP